MVNIRSTLPAPRTLVRLSKPRYHLAVRVTYRGYNVNMSKGFLLLMATIGGFVGSYVPVLLGDTNFLDGWSILGGVVGGLLGIWLGVKLYKRFM